MGDDRQRGLTWPVAVGLGSDALILALLLYLVISGLTS